MNFRALFVGLLLLAVVNVPLAAETRATAEKSLDLARQTVAAEPQNGRAHVALAIALGKMTDFTDNRGKMAYAREIKAEAEIGLQLDPTNAEACCILGKWHDSILRLNPILKAIAATLYGTFPEASAADAEKYFRLAARLAPQSIASHGELATFLQRRDRSNEAQLEWKKVLTLTPADAEDRQFLAEAKRMTKP